MPVLNGTIRRIIAIAWGSAGRVLRPASQQDTRPAVEGFATGHRIAARDLASDNDRASRFAAVSWRGPRSEKRRAVVKQNTAELHRILDRRGRA